MPISDYSKHLLYRYSLHESSTEVYSTPQRVGNSPRGALIKAAPPFTANFSFEHSERGVDNDVIGNTSGQYALPNSIIDFFKWRTRSIVIRLRRDGRRVFRENPAWTRANTDGSFLAFLRTLDGHFLREKGSGTKKRSRLMEKRSNVARKISSEDPCVRMLLHWNVGGRG